MVRCGGSGPRKVTEIGTSRKPIRSFLFVANSNLSRISNRFQDTATKISEIASLLGVYWSTRTGGYTRIRPVPAGRFCSSTGWSLTVGYG